MSLFSKSFLRYGAMLTRGKALAAFILAVSLAVPAMAQDSAEAPREVRVMTLGDSLTAGYGLKKEDGFAAQMGRWLRENGTPGGAPVRFSNASVSGSTTAGGLRRADWVIADGPDALIVELGGNDILRGVDPAETRANLDKILGKAAGKDIEVLLVGLIAKDNYGPDYRAAFNAIYPDLAEKYGTLLQLDFFEALPEGGAERVEFIQGDGTHPNAKGVALIVEDMGPTVQELIGEVLAGRR